MGNDVWADWLLSRRDGDDPGVRRSHTRLVEGFRDGLLDRAAVAAGDVVLDVGTGDGLIAFGALDRGARVVFSDVSAELLDVCRSRAAAFPGRCDFVLAAADDLTGVSDASVDVVTARSVLIYVADKPAAFAEFFRVLRPGGRLSIFEPINSFATAHGGYSLFGLDVSEAADLFDKIRAVYTDDAAMTGFDERHLLLGARAAGFTALTLDHRVEWDVPVPAPADWEARLHTAPNPLAPTYAEAMAAALTPAEDAELRDLVRRLVEAGEPARHTAAVAFLSAARPD